MNHSVKKAFFVTTIILASPCVCHAGGFFDSLFHFLPHNEEQPAAAEQSSGPAATPSPQGNSSSSSHARHKPRFASRYTGKPVLSGDAKYLSGVEFTKKFSVSGEAQKQETDDATEYVIVHDTTLQRGDALMTQNGIVVFDPDWNLTGKFLEINHEDVPAPLQKRLTAFLQAPSSEQSNSAPPTPTNDDSQITEKELPKSKIQTTDGQIIRFVGGAMPQNEEPFAGKKNTRWSPSQATSAKTPDLR